MKALASRWQDVRIAYFPGSTFGTESHGTMPHRTMTSHSTFVNNSLGRGSIPS
jgi:hypothetical protein